MNLLKFALNCRFIYLFWICQVNSWKIESMLTLQEFEDTKTALSVQKRQIKAFLSMRELRMCNMPENLYITVSNKLFRSL
jgi:hypothetical protein